MNIIKDLRVLKAIVKQSELTTNNGVLTVDNKYKYLTDGYIVAPIKYKGKRYVSRYIGGCFCPYITELK